MWVDIWKGSPPYFNAVHSQCLPLVTLPAERQHLSTSAGINDTFTLANNASHLQETRHQPNRVSCTHTGTPHARKRKDAAMSTLSHNTMKGSPCLQPTSTDSVATVATENVAFRLRPEAVRSAMTHGGLCLRHNMDYVHFSEGWKWRHEIWDITIYSTNTILHP